MGLTYFVCSKRHPPGLMSKIHFCCQHAVERSGVLCIQATSYWNAFIDSHGHLQSCVGTQARLDYVAFDAKSVSCHYTVRYTYVCEHICYMLVTMYLRVRSS